MATRRTAQHDVSTSVQNDRRVRKTTASLRDALHALIVEKPYDEIAVKEILDRANVGRSTFYSHFRDKDELLVSSIEEIIHAARAAAVPRSGKWYERILWFSLPIFEYHERHSAASRFRMPGTAKTAVHTHLRALLVTVISDAAAADLAGSGIGRSKTPRELVIQTIASTFIIVFDWWLEQKKPLTAAQTNAIFRSLMLPTLATL